MRATSIIFRRELGGYLRSPLTWVIAAFLLLVEGIFFQAWALRGEQLSALVLERYFFISSFAIGTAGIIFSFRLIAEERQNHSMVLLSTSPVRDIVEQSDLWWVRFQQSFMRGIFNLKDVIFYVCMTYFFLLLAVKTLEAKRWQ
jgi:hypothetical protein